MRRSLFPMICLLVFTCCTNRDRVHVKEGVQSSTGFPFVRQMKYARNFSLSENDSLIYIVVSDPWSKSDTLATYMLIKKGDARQYMQRADFVLEIPVERVAVLSSVYLGMFSLLDERRRVVACNYGKLIYDSILYNRFLKGDLIDLGESSQIDVEAVIGASPQLLMKYIYGSVESSDQKIINAGIPVAYNLEFMETHPLGRAEWLKFVAAFIGKYELADSVFNSIEKEYSRLSEIASTINEKPAVLDGSCYKGIWYAAGGNSFPATLYADAGAEYYWKNDSSNGSIPLSFEAVLEKQADADFWIGPSAGNKKELLGIESRYALLKAFKLGRVYHYGKRINPDGGLDYFESGVTRPDIILKDLLWVFHPDLLDSSYQPVYFEKIKD